MLLNLGGALPCTPICCPSNCVDKLFFLFFFCLVGPIFVFAFLKPHVFWRTQKPHVFWWTQTAHVIWWTQIKLFPSQNLMCFDGPKNLMCFDGPTSVPPLQKPHVFWWTQKSHVVWWTLHLIWFDGPEGSIKTRECRKTTLVRYCSQIYIQNRDRYP